MWSPVRAMLWEWWRLTRRQVLFCGALSALAGWALVARAEPRNGYVVFLLLVNFAVLAWVSILARMARKGFPLPLAYSRPVPTSLLVAVPMLYLAFVCAATYAVPAAAFRMAYGTELPLLPVAVLLAAGSVVFCASSWFTRAASQRFIATLGFVFVLGPALRWLDPWKAPAAATFPPPLTVDSVALDPARYLAVALVVIAAYVWTVRGVEEQRHGEGLAPPPRAVPGAPAGVDANGIVERVRDSVLALVRVPCPTSSPLAAELWLEMKSRGLPVLAIGIGIAACMPLLTWLGNATGWSGTLVFIGFAAVLPFFAGISVSFWNRESSLRAPMSGFEAVRPLTTARLVGLQVAVAVASILGAWAVIGASAWLSAPLFKDVIDFAPLQRALVATLADWSMARLASAGLVGIIGFSTVVAFLAAIRAFSVRYGVALWLGSLVLVVYAIAVAFAVAAEVLDAAVIGAHVWAAAAAIPLATAYAATRALAGHVLLPSQAAALTAVWAVFAGTLVLGLRGSLALADLAPGIVALMLTSLLLPLTAGAVVVWAHGQIRHA